MEQNSLYLPHEIWNHIIEKLDEPDLEEVSLVCKQFLSITNPFKTSLQISDDTMPILPRILRRFQHIESITICVKSPYVDLLHQISCSDLNSKGRKGLKTLSFGRGFLDDSDLIVIADLFPWLEEIVIPCPPDREFECLQLKLLNLRKVAYRWKFSMTIPKPLNWSNLEEIDVEECFKIGEETIGFMMKHCPKLTSLKLPYFKEAPLNTNFSFQNSIRYMTNLQTLSFNLNNISKDHINSFMEAKPPLKKLQLNGAFIIENQYLMLELLQACPSIQELSITNSEWLLDSSVEKISHHLPKLTHILLQRCSQFSNDSFFILTKNCPFLQVIKLPYLRAEGGKVMFSKILHKRNNIRHLDLRRNRYLDDKALKEILAVCPNLQSINVSWGTQLTDEGIQGLLKTCVSLTELKIGGLRNVTDIFGKDFEGETIALKIIELGDTRINDMALSKIGKVCTGLESLSITGVERVTKAAVTEVVRNCKKLKNLNLSRFKDLDIKFLDGLVSNSSIKQLVPPNSALSEDDKKRFRNNGCKICDVSEEEW